MTEAQYNKLQSNRGVWDLFQQVQTVNTAHPQITAINEVYKEITGQNINLSCGACVVSALKQLYNEVESFKH